MLNKKSVDDINVKGKRVLCRCDFNVPLDGKKITDETRLVAALPTIKKLISDGGKVILCSHLGKPKGPDAAFSLEPVAERLSALLGQEVKFAADDTVVGENAKAAVAAMNDGDVILLENTRFRAEETKNGEAFSKDLASICDVFVNDAFGTAQIEAKSLENASPFFVSSALWYYTVCRYSCCRLFNAEGNRFPRQCSQQSGKTFRSNPWWFESIFKDFCYQQSA